jgi:O-antigen ligase
MPPFIALIVWLVGLLGLVFFDPAHEEKPSLALWVPLLWLFIQASRLPAQWLGAEATAVQSAAFEEGNPIDRIFFFGMIFISLAILSSRPFKWQTFFSDNTALVAFIGFALISVLWSDAPLVSFKRWFRDLGNYLVILVILSDARPLEAVRTTMRRLCYLLVSLSVLLVKYYPQMGKQYSEWTGAAYFVGATMGKNGLGVLCLVSGIFFFWDTVTRWHDRKNRRTRNILLVNFLFIGMTLWLLNISDSATSRVCLVLGCLVITAAHSDWGRHHPKFLKTVIPTAFALYVILAFGFNLNGNFAGAVGRDPTLTDRTLIWKTVLSAHTNPLLGTGYESFWLGPRLQMIWKTFGPINESHNGYLEVYLNLGLIGDTLLFAFIISSYRKICKNLNTIPTLAILCLAFWTIMLFYNMTEAAFKAHLMWETFLLATISVPIATEGLARAAVKPGPLGNPSRFHKPTARNPGVGYGGPARFKNS